MTPEERIKEIQKYCGLSTENIRAVIKAEMISAAKSLARGEGAVLLGRCVLTPRIRDGELRISSKASVSLIREAQAQYKYENLDDSESVPVPKQIAVDQMVDLL